MRRIHATRNKWFVGSIVLICGGILGFMGRFWASGDDFPSDFGVRCWIIEADWRVACKLQDQAQKMIKPVDGPGLYVSTRQCSPTGRLRL